jgi:multidrug efflux system membrane fusion protein
MRLGGQLILTAVILVVTGAGTVWLLRNPEEPERKEREISTLVVRTVPATLSDFAVTVRSQGTVEPRTMTTLVAEVAGRIIEAGPRWAEGAWFEKDTLLLRIDTSDYDSALAQADVEIAQAELALAREREEAEAARAEWGKISVDATPSALLLREPQLREAEALLAAARTLRRKAELDLERTAIRAPYDARLVEKSVEVGQFVARGSVLGRVYAVDHVEVRLPVSDDDLAVLDLEELAGRRSGSASENGVLGPEVALYGRYLGAERTWTGTVVRVEGEIDRRTRLTHLVVRVFGGADRDERAIEDGPAASSLPIGLFVRAEIHGRPLEAVITLPREAVRGGDRVIVADAESRLRTRRVEVVRIERDRSAVRTPRESTAASDSSSKWPPLAIGDRILTEPPPVVVEGMRVAVESVSESVVDKAKEAAR